MKTKWPALQFGCLLLVGVAMSAFPASAQVTHEAAMSTAGPLSSISGVKVVHAGHRTTVRISGTGELRYQTSRLDSPARLVLDFEDTRLAVSRYTVPSLVPSIEMLLKRTSLFGSNHAESALIGGMLESGAPWRRYPARGRPPTATILAATI